MSNPDYLIFAPTLNEAGNIENLLMQLLALQLPAHILVVDDGSSDGTDQIVEKLSAAHPAVKLHQRGSRQGVGSAHLFALRLAKTSGYRQLITMDADFSHKPSDVPRFLAKAEVFDIVVGSRFVLEDSLADWNLLRRGMTHLGHWLTQTLLALPYDASGGFRVYNMDRLSLELIDSVQSKNYDFFFESLTILHRRGLSIAEVPIALPARIYGESKMRFSDIYGGFYRLLRLSWRLRFANK